MALLKVVPVTEARLSVRVPRLQTGGSSFGAEADDFIICNNTGLRHYEVKLSSEPGNYL
jgi:hypothetical protein